MAYADANTANRKLGAGAAVLLIEGALAWAVVAGLAYSVTRVPPKPNPRTTNIPLDPPKTPPPPQPRSSEAPKVQPITVPRPDIVLTDPKPTIIEDPLPGLVDKGDLGTITFPRADPSPTPSPAPRFAPKAAKPKGDASRWLGTDDYPLRDSRERHEGRVTYRLSIDASGKVTGCSVVSSSGWPGLDNATCALLPKRASFEAARGESGEATAGSFTGSVSWRLPPEE